MMWSESLIEEDYDELCVLCDEILRCNQITEDVISISWLHVMRLHPMFIKNYVPRGLIVGALSLARNIGGLIINVFGALFDQGYKNFKLSLPSSQIDILFLSHLLNTKTESSTDFYFGDLPDHFASLVIKINHTQKSLQASGYGGMVLPRRLNFLLELKLAYRALYIFYKLFLGSFDYSGRRRMVSMRGAFEALSMSTLETMRIQALVSKTIEIMNPKFS